MLNNANNLVELNNANFFIDNNPNGYMTKESFLQYVDKFDETDSKHFHETLFYTRKNTFKLTNLTRCSFNPRNGANVTWFHITTTPVLIRRLLFNNEILKFIEDCYNGKLNHNISFHGLKEEANSKNHNKMPIVEDQLEGDIDPADLQNMKITNISSDVLVDNYEEPFIEDTSLEGYLDGAVFKNLRSISLDDPIWLNINMDDFNNY